MKFSIITGMAFQALRAHKSRSSLAILGIVIGIGSVVVMTSIGYSAQLLILSQVSAAGANGIFIEPGPGDDSGLPTVADVRAMTMRDVEALRRSPSFSMALPAVVASLLTSKDETYLTGEVVGTTPDTVDYDDLTVATGRFFTAEEARGGSRIAVIGSDIEKELFPNGGALGGTIEFKNQKFTVIGTLAPIGTKFFQNMDKRSYVPYVAMQTYLTGTNNLSYIGATVRDGVPLEEAVADAESILRSTHNIDNPNNEKKLDNFRVRTGEQAQQILGTVTTALNALLISIAAISLLVGGIGIMNIMLVSVTERTKEIGLRMAVGARKKHVLLQFLAEAVALTGIGALIGLVLGAGLALGAGFFIIKLLPEWQPAIPLSSVTSSLAVAFGTGVLFGVYPAAKAARLRPIEALRSEN